MQADLKPTLDKSLPHGAKTKAAKHFGISKSAVTRILLGEIESETAEKVVDFLLAEAKNFKQRQAKRNQVVAAKINSLE